MLNVKKFPINFVWSIPNSGTLNLIDLAGSEKYKDENKDDRKVETVNINKSLASLSLVVLKLAEKVSYLVRNGRSLAYKKRCKLSC